MRALTDTILNRHPSIPVHVVYRSPSDFPGKYVVRVQHASADGVTADDAPLIVADTVEEARTVIPLGMYCLGRHPDDVPAILEVWV